MIAIQSLGQEEPVKLTQFRPMALQKAVSYVLDQDPRFEKFPGTHYTIDSDTVNALTKRIADWANDYPVKWPEPFTVAEAKQALRQRGYGDTFPQSTLQYYGGMPPPPPPGYTPGVTTAPTVIPTPAPTPAATVTPTPAAAPITVRPQPVTHRDEILSKIVDMLMRLMEREQPEGPPYSEFPDAFRITVSTMTKLANDRGKPYGYRYPLAEVEAALRQGGYLPTRIPTPAPTVTPTPAAPPAIVITTPEILPTFYEREPAIPVQTYYEAPVEIPTQAYYEPAAPPPVGIPQEPLLQTFIPPVSEQFAYQPPPIPYAPVTIPQIPAPLTVDQPIMIPGPMPLPAPMPVPLPAPALLEVPPEEREPGVDKKWLIVAGLVAVLLSRAA